MNLGQDFASYLQWALIYHHNQVRLSWVTERLQGSSHNWVLTKDLGQHLNVFANF